MSFDDFKQLHGGPQSPSAPKPAAPPVRIDENFALAPGGSVPAPVAGPPASDNNFVAALVQDLRREFEASATRQEKLRATVRFSFDATGRFHLAEILRSSGSADFDRAVLAAFRRVRAQGFSAPEIGRVFEIDFRVAQPALR